MQDLNVLFLQADLSWEDPKDNLARFTQRIEQHFAGEDLIVLPETFTTGFPVDPEPFAETQTGPTLQWMIQTASKTKAVITGSFLLKDQNHFYNSLWWVTPDGEKTRYDKRHVFSMGGEDKKIAKGTEKVIVSLKGWKICPMICYDLRFPVWSKNKYHETAGFEYDLALYVANWPSQRSYPWEQLLIARAIENQSYVLGVNRVGEDGVGNKYSGNSHMIDPKGKIIASAEPGKDDAVSVTISLDQLKRFREKFNVGRDWDHFTIHL